MKWEKKLAKPIKTNLGEKKSRIIRYVFIATIILSLAYSALGSWAGLDANSSQTFCDRKPLTYQAQWYEVYSTMEDYICVWTPMFYVLIVYLFFYAFIPLQIATLAAWFISWFVLKKSKADKG